MLKIKFIIHFSWDTTLRILQFDWLTAFWAITRKAEFCQMWNLRWNVYNNISFHLRSFQRKTNDKLFQKIQKKPVLGPFRTDFAQIWAKKTFPGKKGFSRFLSIPIINHFAETQKKTNHPFLRKMPNWRIDEQTHRQRWL